MEYVYDFDDDIQHTIFLENVFDSEKKFKYPLITLKNKPRYHYCVKCKEEGKKQEPLGYALNVQKVKVAGVIYVKDVFRKSMKIIMQMRFFTKTQISFKNFIL